MLVQARKWVPTEESVVHEARISPSVIGYLSMSEPKLFELTAVTVPPKADAVGSVRVMSSTQLHATEGSIGSWPMSGSSSARESVTARNEPPHDSCPSGSWRTTKRPVAKGSSSCDC